MILASIFLRLARQVVELFILIILISDGLVIYLRGSEILLKINNRVAVIVYSDHAFEDLVLN